jgi:hypothetical protein
MPIFKREEEEDM